jgi:uncharacterized protein (DUF2237 family)
MFVASRSTGQAIPWFSASSHVLAQTHQESPGFSPGKSNCGIGVIKSLPCIVTEEFLEFAKIQGNDLITPMPQFDFPGLKPGDSWCVCARTWLDALNQGMACPVDLEATNIKALQIIPLELLEDRSV